MSMKIKTIIHLLLVFFAVSFTLHKFLPAPLGPIHIVGIVILIPSFILWATARLQLGNSFSVTAQARELVTHGLYSKIRNPVYVFGALLISGFALAVGRPIFLLAMLLIVPMQIQRASAESKVLEEKFGGAYREYRRQTWF